MQEEKSLAEKNGFLHGKQKEPVIVLSGHLETSKYFIPKTGLCLVCFRYCGFLLKASLHDHCATKTRTVVNPIVPIDFDVAGDAIVTLGCMCLCLVIPRFAAPGPE